MLSRCNTSCKMLEQERLQKMSDIAPVGLVWNLNHLQQIKHRLNKPMGNLYGSFSYFTKIWWPHHTGSADGIHSFVAGFPLLEGWHADATLVSELSSNELSLFFSILMKPVPVCTRPMGDWNNKSCTIWLAKAWNNSTRTELYRVVLLVDTIEIFVVFCLHIVLHCFTPVTDQFLFTGATAEIIKQIEKDRE